MGQTIYKILLCKSTKKFQDLRALRSEFSGLGFAQFSVPSGSGLGSTYLFAGPLGRLGL
jgi:hypothetical protein